MQKNGIMDISNRNINDDINLDGEWVFYPGVFVDPKNTTKDDYKKYETIKKTLRCRAHGGLI